MMHRRRAHNVAGFAGIARELVEHICRTSWVLCTGFRWRGLLLLNDSTSEDGATEFAVVRERDRVQVESITFGWLDSDEDRQRIADYLDELSAGADGGVVTIQPHPDNPHPDGSCRHCA